VVLVEGTSDKVAVETLAARDGRDLAAEGIAVVPIGGAHAITHFVERYEAGVKLVGLCDAAEAPTFERVLGDRFYVCVADLEDELIRALGVEAVERIVDGQGELRSFRTLQKQAAWNGKAPDQQLRRFLGSGARRKIRYAALLIEALERNQVPRPLNGLLGAV
jgi:hypothetical protein